MESLHQMASVSSLLGSDVRQIFKVLKALGEADNVNQKI